MAGLADVTAMPASAGTVSTAPVAGNLDQFLASVEQRAFQMARFALQNEADALDLVQEAMLKLVSRYADKPAEQWRPLFFRILQHQITDWHRRQQLRRRLFFWRNDSDNDLPDTIAGDTAPAGGDPFAGVMTSASAESRLHQQRLSARLPVLVEQLPLRQQQCFLLRCWEGLDVKQTAQAMGCSEGSVKTHYSRALASLRQALGPEG